MPSNNNSTTPTTDTSTISQTEGRATSEFLRRHNWEDPSTVASSCVTGNGIRAPSGEILRRHNWEAYRTASELARPGSEKSKSVRIVVRDQQVTYSTTPLQEPSPLLPPTGNGHATHNQEGMAASSSVGVKGLHWGESNGRLSHNGDISLTCTPTSVHVAAMARGEADVKVE